MEEPVQYFSGALPGILERIATEQHPHLFDRVAHFNFHGGARD